MEKQMLNRSVEPTYFAKRMAELGVTDEVNTVEVDLACLGRPGTKRMPLFWESADGGINIRYVGLNGLHTYRKGKRIKQYVRTRLHPDRVVRNRKYRSPANVPKPVFIPPPVRDAYHRREKHPTLVVTEGEFKAMKAALHGLFCIGIPGVYHYAETTPDGPALNREIAAVIRACGVDNVVFLTDSDCFDVIAQPGRDLFWRPYSFCQAIHRFRELCRPFPVEVHFAHIRPETGCKGLDDLYGRETGREEKITRFLADLERNEFFVFRWGQQLEFSRLVGYFSIDAVLMGPPQPLLTKEGFSSATGKVPRSHPLLF
ncbi:hypothetical protein [Larkinella soli]|uniref:hypothetical protein n=1 Tax=Larkinella soli TaxID=1770527 RepID=UPI000FFCAA3C|nr:hypothetical protein [Larkinella soli]